MNALRNNLVLRFNDEEPVTRKKERTPEEAHQRNVREDDAFQNHPIIVAQINPNGQNIRVLQAELIRFLIRQIRRKNKKLVASIQQIADLKAENNTAQVTL